MLKVKDLIKFLETLDPEANLAYGEQNGAMVGEGYWQHMSGVMLPQCIRTVKRDKELIKSCYVNDSQTPEENEKYMKKYLEMCEKDYKYVSDDDILVSI